jgi:cytochrome c oxidase cbb3-type subunit IV
MLKYIKQHMETIDGIAIYPIISLLIFFIFFALLFVYVLRMRKSKIDEISAYPLSDDQPSTNPLKSQE